MKNGIVDVSGGLRGIYAAGQRGRNYQFYTEYARQGKVLIVSPDDTCGIDILKKDKESLKCLYEKGYKDGQKIEEFLYQER